MKDKFVISAVECVEMFSEFYRNPIKGYRLGQKFRDKFNPPKHIADELYDLDGDEFIDKLTELELAI